MKGDIKNAAKHKLDDYLNANHLRKTPERYAILDAVFSLKGRFSLNQLDEYLNKNNFKVSRATLYNNINLFRKLRFVIPHRLQNATYYEACDENKDHCLQICTICAKVTKIHSAELISVVDKLKLKRFKKDNYTLYIYGICSSCQAQITRRKLNRQKSINKK